MQSISLCTSCPYLSGDVPSGIPCTYVSIVLSNGSVLSTNSMILRITGVMSHRVCHSVSPREIRHQIVSREIGPTQISPQPTRNQGACTLSHLPQDVPTPCTYCGKYGYGVLHHHLRTSSVLLNALCSLCTPDVRTYARRVPNRTHTPNLGCEGSWHLAWGRDTSKGSPVLGGPSRYLAGVDQ